MGTGLRVWCMFIVFAAFACGLCAAQEEVPIFQGFDFESGKIEGWELQGRVSGVLAPTLAEDGRGHYYLDSTNISTLREGFTLISPPFKIDCDTIAFLVKGQGSRVELIDLSKHDTILRTVQLGHKWRFARIYWDTREFRGTVAAIRIIKPASTTIAIDDIMPRGLGVRAMREKKAAAETGPEEGYVARPGGIPRAKGSLWGFLILAIPGVIAYALMIGHAVVTRGVRTTLLFFPLTFAFCLFRGDLASLITGGTLPYEAVSPALQIGHAGIIEIIGWNCALYLAWSLTERVFARRTHVVNNCFALLLFTSGILVLFAVMMEAAAGPMGWWLWQWPGGRTITSLSTTIGLGASFWFLLGTDFFLVWLLFFNAQLKNRWWALLGLLPFPIHYSLHAIGRLQLGTHEIDGRQIAHFLLLSLAIVLPFIWQVKPRHVIDYAKQPKKKQTQWLARLDLVALGIVIAAVCLGLVFYAGEGILALFALPLFIAGVFGWWRSERN